MVNTLITANGFKVEAEVLENGISSLKIPVSGFSLKSHEDAKIKALFSLQGEALSMFRAGTLGDILIELKNPQILQNLQFNPKELVTFLRKANLRAIMFFCKGSSFEIADVEIRVFYVNLEALEDVCCGSVNISVAKILFKKYGITSYKVVQPFNFSKDGKIGGYQEVEFDTENQVLTLKGFATLKKENLIFEPLDISFDENLKPVHITEDYLLLKEIFTDIEVMKTSTAFACGIPANDYDLHNLMNSLIGIKKVFSIEFNDFIGVAGLFQIKQNIVEYGIFLKPKYMRYGFGRNILKILLETEKKSVIVCSIWQKNLSSIKIAEINGMIFYKTINKQYKDKVVDINVYIKKPIHFQEIEFDISDVLLTKKLS